MSNLAFRAYIEPFLSRERSRIYMATVLGVLGQSIASVVFSYHLAGVSLVSFAAFWGLWCLLIGALMPCLCAIYTQGGRARAVQMFIALIVAGLLIFLCRNAMGAWSNLALGAGMGLTATPFWAAYHLTMLAHSSDENRGHEVSIAYVVMAVSSCVADLAGGASLSLNHLTLGIGMAFVSLAGGTVALLSILPEEGEPVRDYWRAYSNEILHSDLALLLLTVASGIVSVFGSFTLTAWMALEGVGPMATAAVLAAQVVLRFFVAPVAGHAMQLAHGHDLAAGIFLYVAGWLLLILPLSLSLPVMVMIASLVWVFAGQFLMCGLDKVWYDKRAIVALGAHESVLNAGRLIGLAAGVLFLAFTPRAYAPGCLVVTCLSGCAVIWAARSRPVCV